MSAESLSIDDSHVELAAELLSDRLECLGELGALLSGLGEDVGKRDTSLGVSVLSNGGIASLTAM